MQDSLPKTVSHLLAESVWVYSLGCSLKEFLVGQGIYTASMSMLRTKRYRAGGGACTWRLRSPHLFMRLLSTFAIFWMWNSKEFKNSKFKPVLLFVKEEGQNIFNSLLALFTTFKYSDI